MFLVVVMVMVVFVVVAIPARVVVVVRVTQLTVQLLLDVPAAVSIQVLLQEVALLGTTLSLHGDRG